MAEVNIYTRYTISLPGTGKIDIGSATVPTTISLDATAPDVYVNRVVLADNAESVIGEFGTGKVATGFKVLVIYCSVDMTITFSGSTDADNSAVKVKGGTYWHLCSDDSKAYNATAAGRADEGVASVDIVSVSAGNDSGSTGYVQLWAAY